MATTQKLDAAHDVLCKIVFVGDAGVGKTSLLRRYNEDTFVQSTAPTIGVDFVIRTMELDGMKWKLQMWDTAGQEKFRAVTNSFYKGAHGIVLCYDTTDLESFHNLATWLEDIQHYAALGVSVLLLGTKADLPAQVAPVMAREFAQCHGMQFMLSSAKDGRNVEESVLRVAHDVRTRIANRTLVNDKHNSSKSLSMGQTVGRGGVLGQCGC